MFCEGIRYHIEKFIPAGSRSSRVFISRSGHLHCVSFKSCARFTPTPSSVLFPLSILFKLLAWFCTCSCVGPDWKPKLFSHSKAHIIKGKAAVNKAITSQRTNHISILHGY